MPYKLQKFKYDGGKMNTVYIVYDPKERYSGVYYIAAKTKEEAIDLFVEKDLYNSSCWGYKPEAKIAKERSEEGEPNEYGVRVAPVTTTYEGKLTVKQLNKLDLLWFDCGNCGWDYFIFDSLEREYTCTKCGFREEIPYVE